MLTLNPEEGREAKKASFSSFLVSGLAQISPPPLPRRTSRRTSERVSSDTTSHAAARGEQGSGCSKRKRDFRLLSFSSSIDEIRPQRFLSFFARSLLRHTLRFPRSRDKPLRSASRVFFRLGNLTTPDCLSV